MQDQVVELRVLREARGVHNLCAVASANVIGLGATAGGNSWGNGGKATAAAGGLARHPLGIGNDEASCRRAGASLEG